MHINRIEYSRKNPKASFGFIGSPTIKELSEDKKERLSIQNFLEYIRNYCLLYLIRIIINTFRINRVVPICFLVRQHLKRTNFCCKKYSLLLSHIILILTACFCLFFQVFSLLLLQFGFLKNLPHICTPLNRRLSG